MGRSSGMTGDDAYAILHKKIGSGGGEGGTSDYNALENKPKLNGVEIAGNKTSADYKIVSSEQGAENNGKFLGVGADGNVTPVDKPTYTANEVGARPDTWTPSAEDVGALPNDTEIPSKTSDLTNDSGFVTGDVVHNIPSGGTSGQVLSKKTNSDYDVEWKNASAGGVYPLRQMQNTDTTATLQPNILYVFPEMASLTVTLGTPSDSNAANEYHFFFASGATATTLTLNNVLSDAYSIESNMKYEVSILENIAYIKGVSTSET